MKFLLIDKIEALEAGQRLVTSKKLTLGEEYLGDHFPTFPVLPGVLMLEGLVQSAAILLRLEQKYAYSIITLQAARNVKYNYFLRPGNTIRYEVDLIKMDGDSAKFKGVGYVGERMAVSARLEVACRNLAEAVPDGATLDRELIAEHKRVFDLLGGSRLLPASTTTH